MIHYLSFTLITNMFSSLPPMKCRLVWIPSSLLICPNHFLSQVQNAKRRLLCRYIHTFTYYLHTVNTYSATLGYYCHNINSATCSLVEAMVVTRVLGMVAFSTDLLFSFISPFCKKFLQIWITATQNRRINTSCSSILCSHTS